MINNLRNVALGIIHELPERNPHRDKDQRESESRPSTDLKIFTDLTDEERGFFIRAVELLTSAKIIAASSDQISVQKLEITYLTGSGVKQVLDDSLRDNA